ncbi:MAG: hypothetical protein ACW98U_01265 [Candidatus Thorarchaeota archaeon]|jgi:hypothetical protein
MKRKHTMTLIILMGFLILSLAAVSSITAFESQANECGTSGCHDTAGTLTLASNATTVNATTGTPFVLQIDAGNGAEWISMKAGWAENSNFTVSERHIEDESASDTNAVSGEISVMVTFTPISPGNFTIRIWTASGSDLASSIDVDVTVTGPPVTITTTTTPPDPSEGLYEIWVMLMWAAPVATAVILVILGYIAIRRNA